MNARELVQKTLQDMVGPIPTSHRSIVGARFDGKHRVTAELEMFDGQPATVELKRWTAGDGLIGGWSVHFMELPGGNVMWTGSQWERDLKGASVDRRRLADSK